MTPDDSISAGSPAQPSVGLDFGNRVVLFPTGAGDADGKATPFMVPMAVIKQIAGQIQLAESAQETQIILNAQAAQDRANGILVPKPPAAGGRIHLLGE